MAKRFEHKRFDCKPICSERRNFKILLVVPLDISGSLRIGGSCRFQKHDARGRRYKDQN
jgi:hypothetical protein